MAETPFKIGEDGKLVVEDLEVCGSGITIYDKATKQSYCSSVMNGVAQLEQGICGSPGSVATTTEAQ